MFHPTHCIIEFNHVHLVVVHWAICSISHSCVLIQPDISVVCHHSSGCQPVLAPESSYVAGCFVVRC